MKKQVTEQTTTLQALVSKHAKLAALGKHLNLFNKEWTKKAKTASAAKATKPKTKTRKARTTTAPATTEVDRHDYDAPTDAYSSDTSVGETEKVS